MDAFKKVVLIIFLWNFGLAICQAQNPVVFTETACGCPTEKSKLNDLQYFQSVYSKFEVDCLNNFFEINGKADERIQSILSNTVAISGSRQQVIQALQNNTKSLYTILKGLNAKDALFLNNLMADAEKGISNSNSVKMWTAYSACAYARIAQSYFFENPENALEEHQAFYQTEKKGEDFLNTYFDKLPRDPIYWAIIVLAIFLSSIFTAFLVRRSISGTLKRHQPKTEDILKDDALKIWLKEQLTPVLTEYKSEQNRLTKIVKTHESSFKEIKDQASKLDKVLQSSGAVDANKLQTVLNDILKRIREVEELPVRRENLKITMKPEDFMRWLQENDDIKEAVKEGLDIVELRDTISRLLPHPISLKELGEIDKETIARYWRIYSTNQEYIPTLKAEILKELKNK